jgi:hypothetical protein
MNPGKRKWLSSPFVVIAVSPLQRQRITVLTVLLTSVPFAVLLVDIPGTRQIFSGIVAQNVGVEDSSLFNAGCNP